MATVPIAVHPSAASLPSAVRAVLTRLTPVHFVDRPKLAEGREDEIVLSLSGDPAALNTLHARPARSFHVTQVRQAARYYVRRAVGEAAVQQSVVAGAGERHAAGSALFRGASA